MQGRDTYTDRAATTTLEAAHRRARLAITSRVSGSMHVTITRMTMLRRNIELKARNSNAGLRPEASGRDMTVRSALSWSGGKDSALTLWTLRRQGMEPEALITTVTDEYDRISIHGVRRELLAMQADAIGAPLVEVRIPPACVNDVYEARMAQAFAYPPLSEVEAVAFGDLFLEDVRAYREEQLAANDRRGLFPLWGRDTDVLAREFIAAGFQAYIACLDPRVLDASFAGRIYDEQLLADLPASVDPCGENGEFHTFVHAGPIFPEPIVCETGEIVEREGFVFCDLMPG